jgi:hypothetical protein
MSGSLTGGAIQLTPSASKVLAANNYLGSASFDWTNQYMPDVYDKEFSRYGNQSITGLLRMTGSELPFESDLIKWSEEGRLHTKYKGVTLAGSYSGGEDAITLEFGSTNHNFRLYETVFISNETSAASSYKGIVTNVAPGTTPDTTRCVVQLYNAGGLNVNDAPDTFTVFVYGSEFKKGSGAMEGSLQPETDIHENSPVIIKDHFEVAGSDIAQVTWIHVETPEKSGYAWYLKAKHDTRRRFDNKLEMMSLEHEPAETGSGAVAAGFKGSQGVLNKITAEGNVWGGGNPTTMVEWDSIVQQMDGQGSIEENTLHVNRDFSFDIDDFLADQNVLSAGGLSYGLFDNDKDMALNLGFKSFSRGGYTFHKQDWRYLNDPTLRGGLVGGAINGIMVPTGAKQVYDMVAGEKVERPFLHVRHRIKNGEDRKYKTWAHGGAGGAATSGDDALYVEFLSERSVCTVGANNFFRFNK